MNVQALKALCFDVFGTVVDWRESVAREAAQLLGARGFHRDWHAFADGWRARYQPAMDEVRSGRRPWIKLDDLHRENLLALLEAFATEGLSETELDHLNRAWHRLDPWPDAIEGLSRLKRKYVLATLSNGNVALMVNMAKRAGLPWDVILGAEVARAYKPLPEAYLSASAMLDLQPRACMMVAAHSDDLVAAAACGLRTAFVARPTEHGPNQQNGSACGARLRRQRQELHRSGRTARVLNGPGCLGGGCLNRGCPDLSGARARRPAAGRSARWRRPRAGSAD